MGGAPRIIRRVISKIKIPGPGSSPIVERRVEVAKKTEAEGKKITRKLKKEQEKELN